MPGGFERFKDSSDVQHAQYEISTAVAALNDTLSYGSKSYDGVVSFSHEANEALAVPLADVNAYNVAPERYEFRSANIAGRRLLLAGTALGKVFKSEGHPLFDQSTINPSFQLMYTHSLWHDDRSVGALQYSFTSESPSAAVEADTNQMEALHRYHRSELEHIAAQTARLQHLARETKGIKSLATGLELEQPIAPNAYVIRWDVKGSSQLVNSDLGPAYDAFVGQVHAYLRELTRAYTERYKNLQAGVHEAYDDQGDGAYIVLPLPAYFSPYDRQTFVTFKQHYTEEFMQQLRNGIQAIAVRYHKTFIPNVSIGADFGYVEENTVGRFESRTMHALANRQKEK